MRLIVTGGAGFIGSNFIRYILEDRPDYSVINFDALTYAGNLENLSRLDENPRYQFVRGDVAAVDQVKILLQGGVDAIINFAAESHVDRSIMDANSFVKTNIIGTQVLLEAARKIPGLRFIQISTDEVYGSLGVQGKFRENSPLAPNSPYAASKASADLLARAYHMTYGVDVIITRCCNNYGPHQFPEKLIPLMTLNAINNHKLPVYGDGLYSRDWVHVLDHSRAIVLILEKGQGGEIYNIGANHEETNLDLVHRILRILNKPKSLIDFVRDRPAHDRRYAVDASRLRDELGWRPKVPFEEGLRETIKWYKDHRSWIKNLKTGDYMYYYQKMYSDREKTLDDL
jgi:dTDP-glucose 4,6-dehydratase